MWKLFQWFRNQKSRLNVGRHANSNRASTTALVVYHDAHEDCGGGEGKLAAWERLSAAENGASMKLCWAPPAVAVPLTDESEEGRASQGLEDVRNLEAVAMKGEQGETVGVSSLRTKK